MYGLVNASLKDWLPNYATIQKHQLQESSNGQKNRLKTINDMLVSLQETLEPAALESRQAQQRAHQDIKASAHALDTLQKAQKAGSEELISVQRSIGPTVGRAVSTKLDTARWEMGKGLSNRLDKLALEYRPQIPMPIGSSQ